MEKVVYVSRWRVRYEAKGGGGSRELLEVGDLSEGEPAFEGGVGVESAEVVRGKWGGHWSRGNARVRLVWDAYRWAGTAWEAQAAGLECWRWMQEHPEGVLEVETAFAGDGREAPGAIHWRLRATLNEARYVEQNAGSSPYADGGCWQMRYDFNVSPEEE